MNSPKYIVLHHSWSPDHGTLSDFASIKKYHIEVNGWQDIGYHYVIEDVNNRPTLEYGRAPWVDGAHAIGFNERSLGICVVGNYDAVPFSLEKKEMLVKFLFQITKVFNIPFSNIIGHRETYTMRGVPVEKTCPGAMINLDEIRMAVEFQNI